MPWNVYGEVLGLKAPPRSMSAPAAFTARAVATVCSSVSTAQGPAITAKPRPNEAPPASTRFDKRGTTWISFATATRPDAVLKQLDGIQCVEVTQRVNHPDPGRAVPLAESRALRQAIALALAAPLPIVADENGRPWPLERAQEILDRINDISFNSALLKELRAISFVQRLPLYIFVR